MNTMDLAEVTIDIFWILDKNKRGLAALSFPLLSFIPLMCLFFFIGHKSFGFYGGM